MIEKFNQFESTINEKVLFKSTSPTDLIIFGREFFDFETQNYIRVQEFEHVFYMTKKQQNKEKFYSNGIIDITDLETFMSEEETFIKNSYYSYVFIRNFIGEMKLRVNVENIGYIDTANIMNTDSIRYDVVDEIYSVDHSFRIEIDITQGDIVELDNKLYNKLYNDRIKKKKIKKFNL